MAGRYELETNGTPADVIAARLRAHSELVAAGCQAIRVVECDTFDWRLHAAGLRLEWQEAEGAAQFVLRNAEGDLLARQPADPSQEVQSRRAGTGSSAVALPPGRVRDQVLPLLGLRSVIPMVAVDVDRHEYRRLNIDQKTVARVAVEEVQVVDAPAAPPARVRIEPVRGYERAAERLTEELAAELELRVIDAGEAGRYEGAPRRPGDYTSKLRVDLAADEPAAVALARVFLHLLDTMERNEPGLRADVDTEFLHDFRVAIRRTRSLLAVARPHFGSDGLDPFLDEFRAVAAATGPPRDLDVHLLGFDGMVQSVPAEFRAALEPLRAQLLEDEHRAKAELLIEMDSPRWIGLKKDWRRFLAEVSRQPDASVTAGWLGADAVHRAHRRLVRDGRLITSESPPEALHELRKRAKVLRYRLEAFGPVLAGGGLRSDAAVKELKGLQDVLGDYQDCDVQITNLRMLAAEVAPTVPTDTVVAIGLVISGRFADQQRIRGEFAGAFARFDSPANKSLYADLTAARRDRNAAS